MIGRTNAASAGQIEPVNQIVKTGTWTDTVTNGVKTHQETLTGLQPKQSYRIIINPQDGAVSASGMSITSPDIQAGTQIKLPFTTNMYGCYFCPLKADITLTINWTRTGGTNPNTAYCIF